VPTAQGVNGLDRAANPARLHPEVSARTNTPLHRAPTCRAASGPLPAANPTITTTEGPITAPAINNTIRNLVLTFLVAIGPEVIANPRPPVIQLAGVARKSMTLSRVATWPAATGPATTASIPPRVQLTQRQPRSRPLRCLLASHLRSQQLVFE